jgi:hypothetical protein
MEVRDEGYSPSPNTGIDKDEGYSPSPGSVSILCDQNSLFLFQSFLGPESKLSSLHSSQVLSAHTTLPFFPSSTRLCVARIPPVRGQVRKPYRWAVCPIPSLTLEEAFPPTNLMGIHSWSEGCSDLEQFKSSMVLVRWRLTQPFWVPSTTFSLAIVVSLSTSPSQQSCNTYPFSIKITEFTFIDLLFKGPSKQTFTPLSFP